MHAKLHRQSRKPENNTTTTNNNNNKSMWFSVCVYNVYIKIYVRIYFENLTYEKRVQKKYFSKVY